MAYYYRTNLSIVDDRTEETINTGATVYQNFGSAPSALLSYQINIGDNNKSSSNDTVYYRAVLDEGYEFVKFECICKELSSSKETQYFTVNPFTSNKHWDLSSVVGPHTDSGERLKLQVILHIRSEEPPPPPETHTLTYDGRGGSNVPEPQEFESGVEFNLSDQIPIYDGYTFVKWIDSNENEYQPSQTVSFDSDITLYAVYEGTGPEPPPQPPHSRTDMLGYVGSGSLAFIPETGSLACT